jgi:hypothetical protein
MAPFSGSSDVKQYRRYRKAGRELNQKIIDGYVNEVIIDEAARILELGQDRQLIMDTEDDMSVLMDFALYEVRNADHQNQVERYVSENEGKNHIERELLAAMLPAHTGLFKIQSVAPEKGTLELISLTDAGNVILTDINFSEMNPRDLIIFFRPIRMAPFTMTSGIAFIFPVEKEQELCEQWQKLEEKGPTERYAWFFKASKRSGHATMYVKEL